MVFQKRLIKFGTRVSSSDISGKLLSVLSDFLKDRKQKVIVNRQVSHGQVLRQEFLKDQSWVLLFSWFILTM